MGLGIARATHARDTVIAPERTVAFGVFGAGDTSSVEAEGGVSGAGRPHAAAALPPDADIGCSRVAASATGLAARALVGGDTGHRLAGHGTAERRLLAALVVLWSTPATPPTDTIRSRGSTVGVERAIPGRKTAQGPRETRPRAASLPRATASATDAAVRRIGIDIEALIDEAVAVVVDRIADLGRSGTLRSARPPGAVSTHPRQDSAVFRCPRLHLAGFEEALVRLSIAVIVEAIAGLGFGAHRPDTGPRFAPVAALHPCVAAAAPAGLGRARITARRCVVGRTIAVVVETIAAIALGRQHLADACARDAGDTGPPTRTADADTGRRRRGVVTEGIHVIVDLSVAVVVAAIAGLRRGHTQRAERLPAQAQPAPGAAFVAAALQGCLRRRVFVRHGVTVVVERVAALRRARVA